MLHAAALLDSEQSRAADRATIAAGTSGTSLMANAGRAVADVICEHYRPCPTLIICGSGNNGGDGFVVAWLLKERGWPVTVAIAGSEGEIRGEASVAKHKWQTHGGRFEPFDARQLLSAKLVVDALFGTGLTGEIEGNSKQVIGAINNSKLPVVSVDIASGLDANDGTIHGIAVRATHTVTFVRPKIGHVLLPGKEYTGELHVFDIGVNGDTVAPNYFLNTPSLWHHKFPFPGPHSHKYSRGHAIMMGGSPSTTGASRLTATAALRVGAGLVSITCSSETLPIYAASLTSVMTKLITKAKEFESLLEDQHTTAICIGPGSGVNERTRDHTLQILKHRKSVVLDADAITCFKGNSKILFAAIQGPTVMTPHEGEFTRVFNFKGSKLDRAREAAKQSNAIVVLKGNDTVIAAPDGRAVINAEAPVWLATAGSGDVLSGIISGLMAQGMPAFEAAAAGVWIHSRAAVILGPGLIAEDLLNTIPQVLKELYA